MTTSTATAFAPSVFDDDDDSKAINLSIASTATASLSLMRTSMALAAGGGGGRTVSRAFIQPSTAASVACGHSSDTHCHVIAVRRSVFSAVQPSSPPASSAAAAALTPRPYARAAIARTSLSANGQPFRWSCNIKFLSFRHDELVA